MNKNSTAAFTVKSWDEKPYDEFDEGRKLTRASATFSYTGDLEGESKIEYLMVYNADGSGNAIALERVVGKLGGRSGSFVMQHSGAFDGVGVNNRWFVVAGSATGDLQGLVGGGEFRMSGEGPYPFAFDYDFE